jgi:NADPH-dependent curcumin reductase CurA
MEDFRFERVPLTSPLKGQMLLRTLYLSIDPYMRICMTGVPSHMPPVEVGSVIVGGTISRVEESRNANFEVGNLVLSQAGWQEYMISDGIGVTKLDGRIRNPTHALSVLGMPGFTAYHGLLSIGKPTANETVVVASASGAVGSVVGQLAKLKGARVVGIAGGVEKCRYVVEHLGFDDCVDHRSETFAHCLADACPNDIDIYFENVGGMVLDTVIPLLNIGARIPVCGLVSHYNERTEPLGVHSAQRFMQYVMAKRVRIEGFVNYDHQEANFERFMRDMSRWVKKGSVKIHESFVDGLERAPQAFIDLMTGKNFGKIVVRV